MAESINALLAGMADIVSKVKTAAGEVYRGSQEISEGNTNLSQRTEEQASSQSARSCGSCGRRRRRLAGVSGRQSYWSIFPCTISLVRPV
jgi:hypothetical protein